uniref:Secreted protein n=1 Tax=Anser brachyrhynchus TaxID=132585 RepID=A0A8B9CTL5_9AVES
MLLARVAVKLGAVLPVLLPVLLLPVLSVGHVHDDQQRRTSDEDELQGPQADVGDGEEVVVADVGAARLPRVAVKVLLLIPPDALGRHHVDQHAEDKDHGEPDAAEGRGVLVDPAEQRLQCFPIHGDRRWRQPESGTWGKSSWRTQQWGSSSAVLQQGPDPRNPTDLPNSPPSITGDGA